MTNWFVTRHRGAVEWSKNQGIEAQMVDHLNPEDISEGDTVMGTLPIPLVADISAKGATYLHLTLEVPPGLRGQELSADQMDTLGAKLEAFSAKREIR